MSKIVYLLSTITTGAIAGLLMASAVQPVSQSNDYTSQLSRASDGRQITMVAPAPQAPLLSGLGCAFGLASIASLWKVIETSGDSSNNREGDRSNLLIDPTGFDVYDTPQTSQNSFLSGTVHSTPMQEQSQPMSTPAQTSALLSSKLNPLVFGGLVSVIGLPGSGKTTLNAAIIRERIKAGHRVIVINHHAAYGEYQHLELYGDGDNINEQITHCSEGLQLLIDMREERYATRKRKPREEWDFMKSPTTFLIEELGEYKGLVNKDLMSQFIKVVIAGCRKANIFVILSSQHDSMEMFGGTSGMAKMLQEGFTKLELEGIPDSSREGGLGPKGTGLLSINGGPVNSVKIPDLSLMFPQGQDPLDFRDITTPNSSTHKSMELSTGMQHNQPAPLALLERSLSLPAYEPEPSLSQDESVILDTALGFSGAVTARDIMKTNRTKLSANEIRMVFVRLSSLGYGSIEGEGKKLTFEAQ